MTAPVHEVIWGPAGPTRNRAVANRIADDLIHLTNECWLIDVCGVHRDLTIYSARTLAEARDMLARLNTLTTNDPGRRLCITIEAASQVLKDRQIRNNLEDILRALPIKFRFVVENLNTPDSFGGSKVIFDEARAGTFIEAARHG